MSTPTRVTPSDHDAGVSPVQGALHQQVTFLPRAANVPPWMLQAKDARWKEVGPIDKLC